MINLYNRYHIYFLILVILAICVIPAKADLNDPTLSVYYSFDDENDTIKDGSKNGNDGKVVGTAKWENGVIEKAISLDGSTWIDMHGPEFKNAPVDGITLAFWVNHTGSATDQSVFDAIGRDHDNGLYHVEIETEGVRWFHRDETNTTVFNIRPSSILKPNEWVHYAGTYDSTTIDVFTYRNGEETHAVQGTGAKLSDNWGVKASIGQHGNSRWLTGLLDEFYIFGRALSENEINKLKDGKFLAVEPEGKLATTWSSIKSHR